MNFILNLLRPVMWQIISVVVAILVIIGVYFLIRHQGVKAEEQRQSIARLEEQLQQAKLNMNAYADMVEKADAVAKELEAELATSQQKQQQLNGRLKNELAKQGVYRDCRVPIDGVQLLKDARAAGITTAR